MENGGRAERVTSAVERGLHEGEARMRESIADLREYAENVDAWIRKFARERPVLAIACAAGLGFALGRLASRA